MQREGLSFVVCRCAGWASASDQDVGAVRALASSAHPIAKSLF